MPDDAQVAVDPASGRVRLSEMRARGGGRIAWTPPENILKRLTQDLDLLGLRKLRLEGRLVPVGRTDWDLEAHFGATVVQPCVVTLAPVRTRIETDLLRRYRADLTEPEPGTEVEMPEDDSLEPLTDPLDLTTVLREEISLALPPYPRATGAELEAAQFTEPGKTPLSDEAARPFGGLAALRDRLGGDDGES